MGDLVHAFPRTWREELLVLLRNVAHVTSGAFASVASMLEVDNWLIPLSGVSWQEVRQGLPEGGRLGSDQRSTRTAP